MKVNQIKQKLDDLDDLKSLKSEIEAVITVIDKQLVRKKPTSHAIVANNSNVTYSANTINVGGFSGGGLSWSNGSNVIYNNQSAIITEDIIDRFGYDIARMFEGFRDTVAEEIENLEV